MTENEMLLRLRTLLKPSRFEHTLGVMRTAEKLALQYGADEDKARVAGILHDCAKNIPDDEAISICKRDGITLKSICYEEPSLIHAPLGAHLAQKEYGICDKEILDAIYYHTTGHENMPLLTKILYIADAVEPTRTHAGVELLRETVFKDINEALIRSIDATIRHIINKGGILDCDTVAARNYLITEKKRSEVQL